jgi:hypothetical protein
VTRVRIASSSTGRRLVALRGKARDFPVVDERLASPGALAASASNDGQAFDFVARQPIGAGQELTFDYAMRNFTIDHFPAVCLCGAARCRGSVTGWKDLPAARKADYGELVAPYLRTMDDEIRQAAGG